MGRRKKSLFKVKVGFRKPSIKKSFKARTTGRAKRAIKKSFIPFYGKKGSGWIKNPKKAAYNKVYNKTTFGGCSGCLSSMFLMLLIPMVVLILIFI